MCTTLPLRPLLDSTFLGLGLRAKNVFGSERTSLSLGGRGGSEQFQQLSWLVHSRAGWGWVVVQRQVAMLQDCCHQGMPCLLSGEPDRFNSQSSEIIRAWCTWILSGRWGIIYLLVTTNGVLPGGSGTTIWDNTQISYIPQTKHITQNYTNNEGHTTHNEYNANTITTIIDKK
jgi:hypothetical protein